VNPPSAFEYAGSQVPATGRTVVSVEPPGVERCPSTAGPGRACRWISGAVQGAGRAVPPQGRSDRFGGSLVRFLITKTLMFLLLFGGSGTGLFGSHLGMIPRIHARDARFIPGGRERGWAGRGSRRGAVLLSRVRAASSRRRRRRRRRLRREAACCAREFESGDGGGCFGVGDDDGGSGGSDGSGGAGDGDCGVRARARPTERQRGPT